MIDAMDEVEPVQSPNNCKAECDYPSFGLDFSSNL
jgi:hypothetical protein